MQLTKDILDSVPFQYAADVKSGKIVTGLRIQQAVDRFYKLIEKADEKGYWLDHKKGMAPIKFIEKFIVHTDGKSAGKPFLLEPFQQFRFYNTYGWQRKNEEGIPIRLIRNIYISVAKKNGKTAEEAADNLYMIGFDNEQGAQVYVGATKEEQARLCFDQSAKFVDKNWYLSQLGFYVQQKKIRHKHTNSFIAPLGGDSKTQDGVNAHKSTIDEYHAHKDNTIKENLESSSVARLQPVISHITTAGFNKHGVCKLFEDMCIDILEGVLEDDTFLIMIHKMDKNDDWEDPKNWIKCNPNLNVTVSLDSLKKEYTKAKNLPASIVNFKTKSLNMWEDGSSEWIPSQLWDLCTKPIIEENFVKLGNCGAFDLSSTKDLTSYAMISEPDQYGIRDLKVWCFCPLDRIRERSREDKVPYEYWSSLKRENAVDDNDTYLIPTPGNMVDYNKVKEVVIREYFLHKTSHCEYDRKFSGSLVQGLMDNKVELSPFTQTLPEYTSPTKELEILISTGKIRAGKNPILKWALSGCVPLYDTNENVKLNKATSTKRIDPIIATIMALAGTLAEDTKKESKYNDPNVIPTF